MNFFNSNGRRIAYRETGRGPLLILLPGNTASSALHTAELEYFGARFHTVALDLPGTGQSERIPVWPTDWWQESARTALALVEFLGETSAVMMGTSGGAVAALWAAIDMPGRVRAVIADSTNERSNPRAMRAELANRSRKDAGQAAFWSDAHGPDWEQVVEADTRVCELHADRGGDWFSGRLHEIRCPVLFTASLRDNLLNDVLTQVPGMAMQIPGAQAYLCNGGSHPLMWSRPREFRAAADSFLNLL